MDYSLFRKTPLEQRTVLWLSIGFGLLSFAATYWASLFGFRWDEHGIAYGAQLIAQGEIPYKDFGFSFPILTLYLQSLGHFLFPTKYFFSYGFSASLINGLWVGGLSFFLLRILSLSFLPSLALLILAHFTFFGAAGCIWYNQLSSLWFSIAFLIFSYRLFFKNGVFSFLHILLIALLSGLTLLSKQDLGGISILLFPLLFLIFSPTKKLYGSALTFFIPLILFTVSILIFIPLGGEPWAWLHHGQPGYDGRTGGLFTRWVWLNMIRVLGQNAKFTPVLVIAAFEGLELLYTWKKRFSLKKLFQSFAPEIFIFGVLLISIFTRITSGNGGGLILPHLTVLILILALMHGKSFGGKLKRVFTITIALTLLLALFLTARRWEKDMFNRFESFPAVKVKHLQGYRVAPRMKKFLEEYSVEINALARKKGRKLRGYINGMYPLMHPKLDSTPYQGPLWPHGGTMATWDEMGKLVERLEADPPDIFVYFHDLGRYYWGDFKPNIDKLLREQYTFLVSGNIDIIGSGGAVPSRPTLVYIRKNIN